MTIANDGNQSQCQCDNNNVNPRQRRQQCNSEIMTTTPRSRDNEDNKVKHACIRDNADNNVIPSQQRQQCNSKPTTTTPKSRDNDDNNNVTPKTKRKKQESKKQMIWIF